MEAPSKVKRDLSDILARITQKGLQKIQKINWHCPYQCRCHCYSASE
jgi:hypothetical protein